VANSVITMLQQQLNIRSISKRRCSSDCFSQFRCPKPPKPETPAILMGYVNTTKPFTMSAGDDVFEDCQPRSPSVTSMIVLCPTKPLTCSTKPPPIHASTKVNSTGTTELQRELKLRIRALTKLLTPKITKRLPASSSVPARFAEEPKKHP